MVPCYFQGLGAHLRSKIYSIDDLAKLGYGDYTTNDLIRWNNSAVALIEHRG